MILVYHAKEPTFGLTRKVWPDDYKLIARIDTDNIEEAFYLTQHFYKEWWENKGIDLVKKSRSTSVGDVLVDVKTGNILHVDETGYSVIGKLNSRLNPYSPRIIERTQKEARELFNALMEVVQFSRLEYNDLMAEQIGSHLDDDNKNKLISIPEELIYKAMNELERSKIPKQKIDLTLNAYRRFLRLPLSHYKYYRQWTEWD